MCNPRPSVFDLAERKYVSVWRQVTPYNLHHEHVSESPEAMRQDTYMDETQAPSNVTPSVPPKLISENNAEAMLELKEHEP